MKLDQKHAVVTGAARGIGEAIARCFLEEGAKVALLDRDEATLRSALSSLAGGGATAIGVPCDVADEASVDQAMTRVLEWAPRIDILVNCAGINNLPAPVTATTTEHWDAALDTNLRGAFLLCRTLVPRMKDGAAIVHVASILGLTGVESCSAYSASKGGLIALTRAMARDHAPRIRVNCVCPGAIDTAMFEAYVARSEDPVAERARIEASIPLGRIGTVTDVARAVLFLASNDSAWITGQAVVVDGGDTA
jgi:NAD(P)-dependent dehydrogenase (short-subunit alcohol dehydrogenase family)